ncbi:type III pantothenate kinase [Anaplasma capra]|uniref:type III pantothenate kinase n=1 Tax=Anaplasma capra TaxID=1562740 RepID=UPI0021D5CECB|nr:type III pantothenate kinase [Anaplasma capra]MCU7611341.1 type III pantothenate kinase [Anaplasma capra]MCU7612415.1 type III pantothenate kinase [Anaplasma capra]
MIIAVDVGNTATKVALCKGSEIIKKQWRISTCKDRTASEYFAILRALASHASVDLAGIRGAVISSVVPATNRHIEELCESFLSVSPVFVASSHAALFGLKICLEQKSIGADRVADLVAAKTLWPAEDLLVIDMGTITVFNLLDKNGSLYGQVAAPGVSCLAHSIRECTALLPQALAQKPERIICDSIAPALEGGLYWGYRYIVEGITKQIISEEEDRTLRVVATGGATHFFKNCDYINNIDGSLTIRGIAQVYEKTRAAT